MCLRLLKYWHNSQQNGEIRCNRAASGLQRHKQLRAIAKSSLCTTKTLCYSSIHFHKTGVHLAVLQRAFALFRLQPAVLRKAFALFRLHLAVLQRASTKRDYSLQLCKELSQNEITLCRNETYDLNPNTPASKKQTKNLVCVSSSQRFDHY